MIGADSYITGKDRQCLPDCFPKQMLGQHSNVQEIAWVHFSISMLSLAVYGKNQA